MNKSIDYDRVSKVYDNVRVGNPEMVSQLLEGSNLDRDSFVLDVGCGTGNNTLLFAESTKAKVIGSDISYGMLQKASEKTKHIPFVQAPADFLPFADETFHLAFMTEVIHHLPSPDNSIAAIYRVLKRGGSVCVVTQSHKQIDGRMTSRFFPASARVDKERYPDIDVIERYIVEAGFSSVNPKEYMFRPTRLGKEYLHTVENRGYSMLHKLSKEDYDRGFEELRAAFDCGEELTYSAGYTFVWATKE